MLFDKSLVCQDTNCPEMQPSKKYRPAKTSFDQALKKIPGTTSSPMSFLFLNFVHHIIIHHGNRLSQTAGFTFGLEQAKDVVLANCGQRVVSWRVPACISCYPIAGKNRNCMYWGIVCPSRNNVPGPLTLRMIERLWSSMNSTRT